VPREDSRDGEVRRDGVTADETRPGAAGEDASRRADGGQQEGDAVDRGPLVLSPRPRLRRIGRTAVAAAVVVAMGFLMVLTLRYSRESLAAAGRERPPLAAPPPMAVERIERMRPPAGLAVAEPAPTTVERVAPIALPAAPARREYSRTETAMRAPLVTESRSQRHRVGGRAGGASGRGAEPAGLDLAALGLDDEGAWLPGGGLGESLLPPAAAVQPRRPEVAPEPAATRDAAPRNLLPSPATAGPATADLHSPAGTHLLRAGTFIPATVAHRVVSDQPGLVRAVVSRDVLDSRTATQVLIPRGTVLLGRQGSLPTLGQNRLAVVWDRLQLPDGRTLRLAPDEALPSAASDGSAGLPGRTRQHWARRYGAAVLLSLVGAGVQLAQPQRRGGLEASPGEVAAGALGLELGRLSQQILRQYADLPPTVELAPGARVHAVLLRDLSFPPSRPGRAR
jgi:type IV secretory pathway VirB10-like protein